MKFSLKDLKPTAEKWGRKLGNAVRKSAPRHLHSMIHTTTKVTDETVEITLYTDEPKTDGENVGGKIGGDILAREFGTKSKSYQIKPRKKKYLAFVWETANQENLKAGLRRRQRESWEENVTFTGRGKNRRAKVDGAGFNNSMRSKGKVAGYDGNRWMFFHVTHPGYKPWNDGKGFITPAYEKIANDIGEDEEMSRKMTRIVTDAVDRAFNLSTRQGGIK